MMLIKPLALLTLILAAVSAHAGDIYKWVDKDGRVHYDSAVPKLPAATAEKLNLKDREVTEEQYKEAEDRLTRDKASLKQRPRYVEPSVNSGYSAPAPTPQPSGQPGWPGRRIYCCVDHDWDDRDEREHHSQHTNQPAQQARPAPQQQARPVPPQVRPTQQARSFHMTR